MGDIPSIVGNDDGDRPLFVWQCQVFMLLTTIQRISTAKILIRFTYAVVVGILFDLLWFIGDEETVRESRGGVET